MKHLGDLEVLGKRVFVRAGLDVLPKEGRGLPDLEAEIEKSYRLHALKPTIDYLFSRGVSQIVLSGHIKRPKGPDPAFSTKQLIEPLEKILGREIAFVGELKANDTGSLAVVLLENLRFWPGEEANDLEFAKKLASLADIYVNEAFETSHREHASIVGVPYLLPHAAGKHLEEEIRHLSEVLKSAIRPFVAVIGGAKIETKMGVIENIAKIAQHVLIGGKLPLEIEKEKITFPHNVLVAELEADGKDISVEAAAKFARILKEAKTIVWNGPMGLFEEGRVGGSKVVTRAIVESQAKSIIGGGETVEFASSVYHLSQFSFVSVGGGAMLEFLAGKTLPGLAALE